MSTARVPPVGRVAPWLTWLFGLLLLSALVLAVLHRGEERAFAALAARAEPAWLGVAALASVFALFAAALPLSLVWLRGRSRRELPAWLRRVPVLREAVGALGEASEVRLWSIRSGLPCAALQLAIFVLDAATLLVLLRALAAPVPASLAFASFVIASAAGTLAWVPGGLGAFEGACVAMLHLHGVSLEPALAGTLLLRGFTFWLPMLPGLAIVRRELGRGGAEAHDVASR